MFLVGTGFLKLGRVTQRNASFFWGVCFLLCLGLAMDGNAATPVNQLLDGNGAPFNVPVTLTEDTHWDLAGSPYLIEGRFIVGATATLSIDPGVVVQTISGQLIQVLGNLKAKGVTFEGVDEGPWRGIYLGPVASASVLENCVVRHSAQDIGKFNRYLRRTAIYLDQCAATIRDNEISVVDGHGIESFLSDAIIDGNAIEVANPSRYAIFVNTLNGVPNLTNNTAAGDGILGVGVPGGGITQSATWKRPGVDLPYIIGAGLVLGVDVKLVIEAGTIVQMPMFSWQVLGTLIVNGTEEAPVKLLGPWLGFAFAASAGDSILNYCEIHDAGADFIGIVDRFWRRAALYIGGSSPVLDHVVIERSGGHGLELHNASPRVGRVTIRSSAWNGLLARAGSNPVLATLNLLENGAEGYHAVALDASSTPQPEEVSFFANSLQGIEVTGGVIVKDTVWPVWGGESPYVLTKDLTVVSGATLKLEPGVTVKLDSARLVVDGTFLSEGTEDDPIVITSIKDDTAGGDSNGDQSETVPLAGDWNGIYLGPAASDSSVRYSELRYSGGDHIGNLHKSLRQTAIYINASDPSIQHSRILGSAGSGIEMFSSHATIESNRFEDVAEGRYAILFHGLNSFPVLTDNEATGPGFLGVFVPAGKLIESGVWTKPGASLPYYAEGDLWIPPAFGLTLTEGVRIEGSGLRFVVEGTLNSSGTAEEPVILSGRQEGGTVQSWRGIYYGPTAGDSSMNYTIIRNAAGDDLGFFSKVFRRTSIYVERSSPSFRQVTVLNGGGSGVELFFSKARLVNSLIAENQGTGLIVGGGQPEILYNTIVRNGTGGLSIENSNIRLDSNLIAFNSDAGIAGDLAVGGSLDEVSHNLLFGNEMGDAPDWLIGNPESGDLLNGNLIADPRFVNVAALNFRLLAGSPAIDAGGSRFADPFATELDGKIRSHGAAIDIGAYEFGAPGLLYTVDLSTRKQGESEWDAAGIASPISQRFVAAVAPERESIYELRVQYTGNQVDTLTLTAEPLSAEWGFSALVQGDQSINLTADLFDPDGYTLPEVQPGQQLVINIHLNPGKGEGSSQVLSTSFHLSSSHGGMDEIEWDAAVVPLPQILTQPVGQSLNQGEVISLRVGASLPGFVGYEWKKDGQLIVGANEAELVISSAAVEDAGLYTVDVIGASGRVSSEVAEVSVKALEPVLPISLSLRLVDDSVVLSWDGGSVPFSVLAKESLDGSEWSVLAEGLETRELVIAQDSESIYFRVTSP